MKPYEILNAVLTENIFLSREPLVHFWHSDTGRFNCSVVVFPRTSEEEQRMFHLMRTFPRQTTQLTTSLKDGGTIVENNYGSYPEAQCTVKIFLKDDTQ